MFAWRLAASLGLCLWPLAASLRRSVRDDGAADGGLLVRDAAGRDRASGSAAFNATTAAVEERLAGPHFDKDTFAQLLKRLQVYEPGGCGKPVLAKATLRGPDLDIIPAELDRHFRFGNISASRRGLYSISDHFEELNLVPKGLLLLRVGQTQGPFSSVEEVLAAWKPEYAHRGLFSLITGIFGFGGPPKLELRLEFEAGLDLRGCWGDLADMHGRPVCGQETIEDLAMKVNMMQAVKRDSAGQSGATIITNLKNHVIKSSSAEEYDLLAEVVPRLERAILEKQKAFGGCWSTGLAPFCAALAAPALGEDGSLDPESTVYWVLTREVALGEKYRRVPGARVNWYDLKGPEFSGWTDGKTMLSKEWPWVGTLLGIKPTTWKHKDVGFDKRFFRRFSSGLGLKACGARDARLTLVSDSLMLRDNDMTDYSLFLNLYSPRDEEDCICDKNTKPTFPITLQVKSPRPMTLAVGVIDYIERRVNTGYFGAGFSTMKPARQFSALWTNMFTEYFRVPKKTCVGQASGEMPGDCQRVELIKKGDRVMSLINSWSRDGVYGREVSNETDMTYTLPWIAAGDEGTVEQILESKAVVQFDGEGEEQGVQQAIDFRDLVTVPRAWA